LCDLQERLITIPKYGSGIGLHRFISLCEMAKIDLQFFRNKSIHVVGSNGKGSTTFMCSNFLEQSGYTVGRFISPHLTKFNERISINGHDIDDSNLEEAVSVYLDVAEKYENNTGEIVGAFEAFCFIAAYFFKKNNVDVVVWEAGIGGRFDTTRCFCGQIAALTSVDLEHTELLGDTLLEISYDKSDIVCGRNSVLVGGNLDINLAKKLELYCQTKGTKFKYFNRDFSIEARDESALFENSKIAKSTLSSVCLYIFSGYA